jgi:hypothetical protein
MIDHLRLMEPKLLEKVLRQRLDSRQPKPIALKRDRAPGAPHGLDEGKGAHGCGPAPLEGACVESMRAPATCTSGFDRWAVPLVSFGWGLVGF